MSANKQLCGFAKRRGEIRKEIDNWWAHQGGVFPPPWFPYGACNFEGRVACFCEFIYYSIQLGKFWL